MAVDYAGDFLGQGCVMCYIEGLSTLRGRVGGLVPVEAYLNNALCLIDGEHLKTLTTALDLPQSPSSLQEAFGRHSFNGVWMLVFFLP